MNLPTKTGFRLLILFEVFLRIAIQVLDYLTDSTMPEGLRNFRYDNWYEDAPAIVLAISIGFLGLAMLVQVVAYVGLFLFWHPARALYLAFVIVEILTFTFFSTFYVEHAVSSSLSDAAKVVSGLILALIFWSPMKLLFDRPQIVTNQSATTNDPAS